MVRRVVIIGAGIVGSSLARELTRRDGCLVTVVDRSPVGRLYGSTGHAPGFVGILGESPVLTELARESVRVYQGIEAALGPRGFEQVGAMEVARSAVAADALGRRAALAAEAGLVAHLLEPAAAVALAPRFVDPKRTVAALHFPADGTARATVITAEQRHRAEAAGARFLDGAEVTRLETRAGRVDGVLLADGTPLPADDVVLACGIWGPVLAAQVGVELPLTPVAHPYVHTARRPSTYPPAPFIRWPEHHVYARDHGDRDGIGTYDHVPLPVSPGDLGPHAERPWPGELFETAVSNALGLLPPGHGLVPAERLNGVFSVTPDNLPLLGPHPKVPGLWSAEAIWVTSAGGAAAALAGLMTDGPGSGPRPELIAALTPDRFDGRPPAELRDRALRHYRDIYATG